VLIEETGLAEQELNTKKIMTSSTPFCLNNYKNIGKDLNGEN